MFWIKLAKPIGGSQRRALRPAIPGREQDLHESIARPFQEDRRWQAHRDQRGRLLVSRRTVLRDGQRSARSTHVGSRCRRNVHCSWGSSCKLLWHEGIFRLTFKVWSIFLRNLFRINHLIVWFSINFEIVQREYELNIFNWPYFFCLLKVKE